jgi:teichuronic acid biosynthesis glycosyltransferase TuaH
MGSRRDEPDSMSQDRVEGQFGGQSWDGLIVFASTTSWDDTWLSEKHLASHLAKLAPVLWVDPPLSALTPLRKPAVRASAKGPRLRIIGDNLARLTPMSAPGVSRPVLHEIAEWATRRAIARAVRKLGGRVSALVVASLDDLLHACKADITVLYGTDDWIAGGELMGIRTSWLEKRERRQLGRADLVVCVSERLKERWSRYARRVVVIPNGCDTDAFAAVESVEAAPDVTLSPPIAGFIGHLSERIDRTVLERIAETGASLLLVGPRQRTFDVERMDALFARENVQWVGAQPFERLPAYMKHITVGLTPYTDSDFNRGSDPLKTLEYLSAGRPTVVSDLPSVRRIPANLIQVAEDSDAFVELTLLALASPPEEDLARQRIAYAVSQNWDARAREFLSVIAD